MIISPRLPQSKGLFGKLSWKSTFGRHLLAMIVAILVHRGRMSAQQSGSAIAGDSRHRGTVGRFWKCHGRQASRLGDQCFQCLLNLRRVRGRYVFIVDTTLVSHQGQRTPNIFSTGNRRRRPAKGRRYSKYRRAARGCHAFVWGLLITPDGRRLPCYRCYYTREYCQQHHQQHRTQADLAADLTRSLCVPAGAEVIVLADTAFESKQMRAACHERDFYWIMPANPERVLSGGKPRPKLWSLARQFRSEKFAPLRFQPKGPLAAMRRSSSKRQGSIKNPRTFYVHEERRAVHSIGMTRIVFSTKRQPTPGKPLRRDETKILLSNAQHLRVAELVELYLLRWQIELFFKELKSGLGMHHYRFRNFESVAAWMEIYRITFLYLEWVRAQQVSSSTGKERSWWTRQRTHGLALAVCQRLEENQLLAIQRQTTTPSGLKKLRKLLRRALPTEHRHAA
jgi:hypothetical protein